MRRFFASSIVKAVLAASLIVAIAAGVSGCGPGKPVTPETGGGAGNKVKLNGAGSTFVFPMMSKWSALYDSVKPGAQVNYQSIGSGGGIRQVIAKTVDFGATDGPMTDEQLQEAKKPVLHIPVVMGAVVPAYYLPGNPAIRFSGPMLADIFLGKITKWNDPALAALNPGVKLPDRQIVVVHRADGSGTTYIWVDYLAKVSAEWKAKVGVATSVNWPVGLGGKGNEGVAGQIKRTPGSLGYVELVYALQNKITFGAVKNPAGQYIKGSAASVSAAGAGAANTIPADLRVSITNAPGKGAYPVSGFAWLLVYAGQENQKRGQALTDFLWWVIHDGQKAVKPLDYARLPEQVVKLAEGKIKEIRVSKANGR
ncbi:MAG: phosphate ABC transporter substrate-binding protein PstS [Actinomycetota bacterium]|nr:phosphate ABC transporter substrate-binding protein PstS [Actinomycetota bacterium]